MTSVEFYSPLVPFGSVQPTDPLYTLHSHKGEMVLITPQQNAVCERNTTYSEIFDLDHTEVEPHEIGAFCSSFHDSIQTTNFQQLLSSIWHKRTFSISLIKGLSYPVIHSVATAAEIASYFYCFFKKHEAEIERWIPLHDKIGEILHLRCKQEPLVEETRAIMERPLQTGKFFSEVFPKEILTHITTFDQTPSTFNCVKRLCTDTNKKLTLDLFIESAQDNDEKLPFFFKYIDYSFLKKKDDATQKELLEKFLRKATPYSQMQFWNHFEKSRQLKFFIRRTGFSFLKNICFSSQEHKSAISLSDSYIRLVKNIFVSSPNITSCTIHLRQHPAQGHLKNVKKFFSKIKSAQSLEKLEIIPPVMLHQIPVTQATKLRRWNQFSTMLLGCLSKAALPRLKELTIPIAFETSNRENLSFIARLPSLKKITVLFGTPSEQEFATLFADLQSRVENSLAFIPHLENKSATIDL